MDSGQECKQFRSNDKIIKSRCSTIECCMHVGTCPNSELFHGPYNLGEAAAEPHDLFIIITGSIILNLCLADKHVSVKPAMNPVAPVTSTVAGSVEAMGASDAASAASILRND